MCIKCASVIYLTLIASAIVEIHVGRGANTWQLEAKVGSRTRYMENESPSKLRIGYMVD